MAFTCMYENLFFSEGAIPGAQHLGFAECDLSFKLGAQLKSLRDVKAALALQVRAAGGNGLTEFTYGQKSRWLAIDDVAFWGKGRIVWISPEIGAGLELSK